MVMVPAGVSIVGIAARTVVAIRAAGYAGGGLKLGGLLGGGGWLAKGMAALGLASLYDLIDDILPWVGGDKDHIVALMEKIDEELEDGRIFAPGPRRDGSTSPSNYLTIDLNTGKAWIHPEYLTRQFVNAVRKNNDTKWYRGKKGNQSKNK